MDVIAVAHVVECFAKQPIDGPHVEVVVEPELTRVGVALHDLL